MIKIDSTSQGNLAREGRAKTLQEIEDELLLLSLEVILVTMSIII